MARTKWNWIELKDKYITGNYKSVSEFMRKNSIASNSYTRAKTSGWRKEKENYFTQILRESKRLDFENEVQTRLRQANLARELQIKGIQELSNMPIETLSQAVKLVLKGLEAERIAYGIDKNTDS